MSFRQALSKSIGTARVTTPPRRCQLLRGLHPAVWFPGLLVAIALSALSPSTVSAHAFLVNTSPQAGQRLASGPTVVALHFSEAVAGEASISLRTADGRSVPTPAAQLTNGGLLLEASVHLGPGVYIVTWQALAIDGHVSMGEFAFAVGAAGVLPQQVASTDFATSWGAIAARWLVLGALLLLVGAIASERLIWADVARRRDTPVPQLPLRPLLLVALIGAATQSFILLLPIDSGAAAGSVPIFSRPALLGLIEAAMVGYALWLVILRPTSVWAVVPIGGALVALSLGSHPGVSGRWWEAVANAMHLPTVGLWIGALARVGLIGWRARDSALLWEGIRRYSTLALPTVAIALASGLVVALGELEGPGNLVDTTYGRILDVKVLLVGVALLLALLARRRILSSPPRGLLTRLTSAETGVLVAAITAAVLLAGVAPPQAARARTETLLGPPPLQEPVLRLAELAGNLAVHLSANPRNLEIRVITADDEGAQVAPLDIQATRPDGSGFDLSPRSCGAGCFASRLNWNVGSTRLAMRVTPTQGPWTGGEAQFSVAWPPLPEDRLLLMRSVESMRSQPAIQMTETVSSGPGSSGTHVFSFSGTDFEKDELYISGGAVDIRPLSPPGGTVSLTAYLPGSYIWYRLDLRPDGRLAHETIISPGHLIQRSFLYGTP